MTRKLTVTYGVRLWHHRQLGVRWKPAELLGPQRTILCCSASGLPNLVGGVGVPGLSEPSRTEQRPSLLHIEPRFGVAYALNDKTVLHGSFGIFRHPQRLKRLTMKWRLLHASPLP